MVEIPILEATLMTPLTADLTKFLWAVLESTLVSNP